MIKKILRFAKRAILYIFVGFFLANSIYKMFIGSTLTKFSVKDHSLYLNKSDNELETRILLRKPNLIDIFRENDTLYERLTFKARGLKMNNIIGHLHIAQSDTPFPLSNITYSKDAIEVYDLEIELVKRYSNYWRYSFFPDVEKGDILYPKLVLKEGFIELDSELYQEQKLSEKELKFLDLKYCESLANIN